MAEDNFEMEEQAENTRNVKKLIQFFVSVVILAVVGFCEILYVNMLLPVFPDGIIRLIAIAGACATGVSAIALLAGKLHWFTRGPQTYAAWTFILVETIILTLNVLLAVQLHDGSVAPWLQAWEGFYPAAPIVAFVGWGIILYLDRDNVVRAFQRDQLDKQQKAEIAFTAMAHRARMKVKHQSLKIVSGYLEEAMSAQPNLLALRKTADQIYDSILSDISGEHISSRIPQTKGIVEGSVSLPQTGTITSPAAEDKDIKAQVDQMQDFARKNPFKPLCGNCAQLSAKGQFLPDDTYESGFSWRCQDCLDGTSKKP